jgi:hypothetical protein
MTNTTKSWRDVLPIHPAADLFPLMKDTDPDALRALGEDIKKNGLTSPIAIIVTKTPDGPRQYTLLDGRNRLDAIERMTGAAVTITQEPIVPRSRIKEWTITAGEWMSDQVKIVEDVDPRAYVVSANIHRRHLDAETRQSLLIEAIARAPTKSDRQLGKEIGVDHKTIARARSKGEDVGRIPHVSTHTDTKGRTQPAHKPASPWKQNPNGDFERVDCNVVYRITEIPQRGRSPIYKASVLTEVGESPFDKEFHTAGAAQQYCEKNERKRRQEADNVDNPEQPAETTKPPSLHRIQAKLNREPLLHVEPEDNRYTTLVDAWLACSPEQQDRFRATYTDIPQIFGSPREGAGMTSERSQP